MMSTVCGCRAFTWNQGELSRGFLIHMLMFMNSWWPIRPSSIQLLASRAAGVKRWFRSTPKHSPFSRAVATISTAGAISLQIGFSHSTCSPAANACMVGS